MIVASLAVAAFATDVIGYAVIEVDQAEAVKVMSADQIPGVETFDYAKTQEHVATTVEYQETPPVGGAHDTVWADCTGTVYTVDIRRKNAVHPLEHAATWITYDPDRLDQAGIDTLSALVEDTPRHDAVPAQRPGGAPDSGPEPGASCASPAFSASPQTNGDSGAPPRRRTCPPRQLPGRGPTRPEAATHDRPGTAPTTAPLAWTARRNLRRAAATEPAARADTRLGLRHCRRPVCTVDRRARVREGSPRGVPTPSS